MSGPGLTLYGVSADGKRGDEKFSNNTKSTATSLETTPRGFEYGSSRGGSKSKSQETLDNRRD